LIGIETHPTTVTEQRQGQLFAGIPLQGPLQQPAVITTQLPYRIGPHTVGSANGKLLARIQVLPGVLALGLPTQPPAAGQALLTNQQQIALAEKTVLTVGIAGTRLRFAQLQPPGTVAQHGVIPAPPAIKTGTADAELGTPKPASIAFAKGDRKSG